MHHDDWLDNAPQSAYLTTLGLAVTVTFDL